MMRFLRAVFLAATLGLPSLVLSAPLEVGDPSFEDNFLNPGEWTYYLGPEWEESDGLGSSRGFEEFIVGFAAEGTDHLGMESGHEVWQDLDAVYEPNTRYTLQVAVGNRNGNTTSANQSGYFLADVTGEVHATGIFNASELPGQSFADAPELVFDTNTKPSVVGKRIRILLKAGGSGRSHFDHIRLDATPLMPEGTAAIVLTEVTDLEPTGARLNGSVVDIGDDPPTVTLFWGREDGGLNPAAWEHSIDLPGAWTGPFSALISGLEPGGAYFFSARATNSAGVSWASEAQGFETPPVPPQVANLAAEDIGAMAAKLGVEVISTGGVTPGIMIFHGPSDGGTDPDAWEFSLDLGESAGVVHEVITDLPHSTIWYYRAFAENPGGGSWAPVTSSFQTLTVTVPSVENRSASGITGTTASLRGEITDTGNDVPEVMIFYGTEDGGQDEGAWEHSVNIGAHAGEFSHFVMGLTPSTRYHFRCRATNAAGAAWAPGSATFTTSEPVPATVVINEFHYKPGEKTVLEEFIELHNPSDQSVDLSGWTLSDAVSYTFPGGTVVGPGEYVVVAENPSVILSRYGVAALGPWDGKLNSKGERIDLRDASGTLRDRVEYGVGFPWPTGADGGGGSAELIHPSLDNDLGGSWRTSGSVVGEPVVYIPTLAEGWRFKKGTEEASDPIFAWREVAFDDSSWSTGRAGFGYGYNNVGHNTVLGDMRNNYVSVYFRKTFTVSSDSIPNALKLRIRIDDGCVVWINGHEVARLHVPDGHRAYWSTAINHDRAWEEVIIDNADDFLFGGTNVIAVHGANQSISSSDFSFDLELSNEVSRARPTPGERNSVHRAAELIPPQIRQVNHSPKVPSSGQPVTITARITDPDGVGPVSLSYQLVDPGVYIRLTDPDYETSWTTVPMRDDGTGGDAVAGDSIFTARLPGDLQTNRRLVRYRITFEDLLGNSQRVPYSDDEQPNFGYYVYDGLPSWQGAFRPGSTPPVTYPATLLDDLPVYTLIANGADVIASQYEGGADNRRFRGTFVHDGVVYDHIEFKNRGEASTYVSGKNKWRFFFNRARDLPVKDDFGRERSETWGSLTGNACASPWAAVHRGMAGIDEALSFRIHDLAGVPSPGTHYYHFRVVRGEVETPPAGVTVSDPISTSGGLTDGQYAGDFWGLYLAIEQPRGSFLDERGLPDGNVYKVENNGGDKKGQGATHPVDSSDWNAFRDAHVYGDPSEAWWRANMDMNIYYTFHAINRLTGNVDLRGGYNHYFYHRSSDNRWVPIPWDLDMMYIAKSHWTTSINGISYPGVIHAHKALLQHPALALEYRNRAREILDLMASDRSAGGGQIGQLIDEFARIVHPPGETMTWANADAAMWNLHPRTQGSDSSANGQTNHLGNFFRTIFTDSRMGGGWNRWLRSPSFSGTASHEDSMRYLLDYTTDAWPGGYWFVNNGEQLGYGYRYLASEAEDPEIPAKPEAWFTGNPAYLVSDLTFESSPFADPQGEGTYAACEWRVAEISGPGIPGYLSGTPRKYEIRPTWTSGEITDPPGSITLPLGVVEAGKTFRVRVRHKDTSGRWSHWSDPIEFTATVPSPGDLVHYWNFNASGTFLEPTMTIGGAAISASVSGAAEVIPHSSQDQGFAGLNARFGDPVGSHLRVNQPLGARLDIAIPTTGHEAIVVKYETRRSGQGAGIQRVSYTLDGSSFIPYGDLIIPDADPIIQVLDFRQVTGVSDNPLFAIRIEFLQGDGGTAGNNRFDNLTVEGERVSSPVPDFVDWRNLHFTAGELADPLVSGPEASAAGDGVANILRYAFGVGPRDPVAGLLPEFISEDGYAFRFRFDPSKPDLVWRVRVSEDLTDWSGIIFDSSVGPVPEPEEGWLSVPLPESGPGARVFVRLEVSLAD